MPWDIKSNYGGCSGYAVVKRPDGSVSGCHSTRESAERQMAALYASESKTEKNMSWEEGMMVRATSFETMVIGKIEHVMLDGSLGTGSKYEIQASEEDPALLLRVYKEEQDAFKETEYFIGVKSSDAEIVEDLVTKADSVRVGQMVSWNSSGGRAEGKVTRIVRNGKIKVPNSSFEITGTPEEPAVAIRLYRDGEPTDTIVGHKMKTLSVKKSIEENDLEKRSLQDLDLKPTESMANNAKRGLELRRKFNRGGTAVGVARARDLSNRKELSPETVGRMYSFFSRHEVDKKGKDWNNSERPSNGKIAWLLWGGDSGYAWSKSKWAAIQRIKAEKSGDSVWYDSPLSFKKNVDNK
jgi:hypothetical protein